MKQSHCFVSFTLLQSPLAGASTSSGEADRTVWPSLFTRAQTLTVCDTSFIDPHVHPVPLFQAVPSDSRLQGASSQVYYRVKDDLDDFEALKVRRRLSQSTGGLSSSPTVVHLVSLS